MAQQDQSELEAAEWLAALDAGMADRAAFERWRREPLHALAFIRVEQVWRDLDTLRAPAIAPEAAAPAGQTTPSADGTSRRQMLWAAGLVGLVCASGGLVATRARANVLETAVGERRRFYIDRHICVDLNTASRLTWRAGRSGNELTLDRGELFVTLSPGAGACTLRAASQSFDMQSGQFDVRLREAGRVDLVALGGQARLAPAGGRSLVVSRGRRLRLGPGSPQEQAMSDGELRSLDAWKHGELLLHGEPLTIALAEYNRYLPEPMVLADETLGGVRLGGRFLTDDPAQFLDALRVNFAIRAERRDGTIRLSRA
jgi:transmembrane sensor